MSEATPVLSRIFQKRITNEIKLMQKDPLEWIDILPKEDDIRQWYFLIRGPAETDYYGGVYIGKLQLSDNYPITPVDFYMLTPNGRFETDKKICLTISGYHPDSWSAMWNIQKILGAFLSVMTSDLDSGISHIRSSQTERKKYAEESFNFNFCKYKDIFTNFNRFIKVNADGTFSVKTDEEVRAEMPKPKEKKKKDEPSIDLGSIKLS